MDRSGFPTLAKIFGTRSQSSKAFVFLFAQHLPPLLGLCVDCVGKNQRIAVACILTSTPNAPALNPRTNTVNGKTMVRIICFIFMNAQQLRERAKKTRDLFFLVSFYMWRHYSRIASISPFSLFLCCILGLF